MANVLKVEGCLNIVQNDINLYIFTLTAGEIYDNFSVSRRFDNKDEGYQRIVIESKIKKLVSYLSGKSENSYPSILPNNILIALDKIKYNSQKKELSIYSQEGTKGLIIDGQHRVKGSYDYSRDFQLVVIAVADLLPKYQSRLFTTINKTQTSLPSSLYLDLISSNSDEDIRANLDGEEITVEQKSIELVKDLNNSDESSLFGMISETGEERTKINLAHLVGLIKPYINYTDGQFKGYSYQQQLKIFMNYFNAIKVVFENDWKSDVINKTNVTGGLMKALGHIFEMTYTTHHNFKENSAIYILSKISDEVTLDSINSSISGGGVKAQESFSKKFIKSIKDKIKDDSKFGNIDL